jgi:hypothetical protein
LGYSLHQEDPQATLRIPLLNGAQAFTASLTRVGFNLPLKTSRMSEELPSSLIRRIALAIATLPWEPWRLPVEEQLSEMGDLLDDPMPESWKSWERNLPQLRYYLSATSQAIRFWTASLHHFDYNCAMWFYTRTRKLLLFQNVTLSVLFYM